MKVECMFKMIRKFEINVFIFICIYLTHNKNFYFLFIAYIVFNFFFTFHSVIQANKFFQENINITLLLYLMPFLSISINC